MSQNRLDQETSPYLLQHADNPVHWQAWGPEALQLAKETDKPILLSVGYAACHWCHVMAHESFEDADTAAVMNELYVNIKVDREERPDIDSIYMHALSLMGQQGGWPLTMFLTPDGNPFYGGTYFPPDARYGRPGFPEVLKAVADFYRQKPNKVTESVDSLKNAIKGMGDSKSGGQIPLSVVDQAAQRLVKEFDMVHGGIGTAPKFPNPSILGLLWRGYKRFGDENLRDAVILALDKMSHGGIYDHLGGGYARYSTDALWLAPHFEKMLYDNAQLIDCLLAGWQETRSDLYATRIAETVDWLMREMIAEGGGFAATLDADSEGEEGKFYVWSDAEIRDHLAENADLFCRAYDVSPGGNWEGKTILNRNVDPGPFTEEEEKTLTACRQTLLAVRDGRIRPGWDDKVLADWNGLMIAALAPAAATFEQPEWLEATRTAYRFVAETMSADGRLMHSWRNGLLKHTATLDDYANMIRAALALYEVTSESDYLESALRWTENVTRHYWDDIGGGYFFTADDAEALIVRTKHAQDNATPSGNGVMAANLARLFYMTGDDAHRKRAEALIAAFSGEVSANFFPLATLFHAAELLQSATQIVIIGEAANPVTVALRRAALESPAPYKILLVLAPDDPLPDNHPANGKTGVDGAPAAYVCVGQTCSLPLSSADALIDTLNIPPSETNS